MSNDPPIGLGIDTTFDDTSVAILRGTQEILANLTLSQYKEHEPFGGVVPERASRKHLEVIHFLIAEAFQKANIESKQLDYIAVSHCPGLLGALLVGLTVAKALAYSLRIPLIGINHIESHPYANFVTQPHISFPALHLVVAGGHTLLMQANQHFEYTIIGQSVDDAAGECMDKVARMFGFPMPGGRKIDECALSAPSDLYVFPRPAMHQEGYSFSFSGLKTAMLRFCEKYPLEAKNNSVAVLSSFFQSIIDVLIYKTLKAAEDKQICTITLSGGVVASTKLRQCFQEAISQKSELQLYVPPPHLATDNAAMVTCLGAYRYLAGKTDTLELEAFPNLSLTN